VSFEVCLSIINIVVTVIKAQCVIETTFHNCQLLIESAKWKYGTLPSMSSIWCFVCVESLFLKHINSHRCECVNERYILELN
jgi:hypothetical protein